jgi:uncharacterized OsmC-like protein
MSEQMTDQGVVNGVDTKELFGTIDAIKDNAEIAQFKFRARNKWENGGLNRTMIDEFYGACEPRRHAQAFVFAADEPPLLLGEDRGANPVEFLLTGLAACVTTSIVYHGAARGINITLLESELEGNLDLHGFLGMSKDVRPGYESIQMRIRIEGDASRFELESLVQDAKGLSPVYDVVSRSVPVEVTVVE